MSRAIVAAAAAAVAAAAVPAEAPAANGSVPFVGGYCFINGNNSGWEKLEALATNATTVPLTRIFVGFFDPQIVYVPGSLTLNNTGIHVDDTLPDFGFAKLKAYIAQMRAGGLTVLLSFGGWDYGCFPYAFMQYSIAGVQNSPNEWKINTFGNGSADSCVAENQYCYVCEDPDQNETLANFRIWPEPYGSQTWQDAVQFVEETADPNNFPVWNADIIPGRTWVDVRNQNRTIVVPGSDLFFELDRDPYADMVSLAVDLGADGIDLDFEEFWHADYFRQGPRPYDLQQTLYKFVALVKDVMININASSNPALLLSHAAGATGAWVGPWWGGNMKGLIVNASLQYPSVIDFMSNSPNAGGINVMTYDLSNDEAKWQCPEPTVCSLSQQVAFFMQAYRNASLIASVGYEIGVPAFPDPEYDATHALPLTMDELNTMITTIQPLHRGGFMWELFKPNTFDNYANSTQVAQAICNVVLPGNPRCSGQIPYVNTTMVTHRRM